MSEFFKKSINDLTREDIEGLKGTLEGQTFEIKERLSESGSEEIWEREPQLGKDRDGPSDKAKERIFKEIVAFANAEGGWLVLGIKETDESPSKASDICPIPDCCVLADRLWQASQDWIDPPLSLHVRGLEIDGKKGVVVFRVPRSFNAPHRLYKRRLNQEAYKRVAWESKPMRMREIQDLFFEINRGSERIDEEFTKAREYYNRFVPAKVADGSTVPRLTGCRITFVPVSGPLLIDRPYNIPKAVFSRNTKLRFQFENRGPLDIHGIDRPPLSSSISNIEPTLRGAYRIWSVKGATVEIEIFESGMLNVCIKNREDYIYLDFVLCELANGLIILDKMRGLGNNADADYVLQIEIKSTDLTVNSMQSFDLWLIPDGKERVPRSGLLLPLYKAGSNNDFNKILIRVTDDVFNALGRYHLKDLDFEISPSN